MNALTPERIEQAVRAHLKYTLGKAWENATVEDVFTSLARTVRDLAMDVMLETERRYQSDGVKMVYYLSMEFLIGRSLGNNLINLGVDDLCRDALTRMGYDLDEVREAEADAALGNGGLGRLAACFLDSMATMGIPGYGYGINYEYGLFKQAIEHGYQVEQPDQWLARGTPWEIERTDEKVLVPLKGRVANEFDHHNEFDPKWLETQTLVGMPYDMPVVGYGGQTVNRLRLYAARASDEFDIRIFNEGHYTQAVRQKISSESVSKILYPRDSSQAGQELRLTQEYFLVACAIRDIIRRYKTRHATIDTLAEWVAIQLNDTHPALAVAELMRILVDEEDVDWEPAWAITVATFGYTNHTLMPEALERWSASLLELLVPRHLQIIYEINRRFLEQASKTLGGDPAALERLSIVEEGGERKIRMSNLAVVGSHSVNGVAAIHSRLMRETVFRDFARLWPERFNNKTNGITPRRWLLKANPALASAISERIGEGWITDLDQLVALRSSADDPAFQSEVLAIKHANKHRLAGIVRDLTRVQVDPDAIFDIQAKRLHEYKRQLLNALHIIHLYLDLLDSPGKAITPRAFLFGGKAAPGYFMAKLILKCITAIADLVNRDPHTRGLLRVAFLPDYRVSLAEKIIPAADVSEQISTAGKEASGTGNMKFALNGAVTVGTLDGANVEIREEVGAENIYIFGLTVEEIERMRREGAYHPWELYQRDPRVRRVIDALQSDLFTQGTPGLFQPLVDSLLQHGDEYFLLADLGAYIAVQERVARDFTNRPAWARKAIHNIAGMGKFSSDRTIAEYAREIWDVQPAGFAAPALSQQ